MCTPCGTNQVSENSICVCRSEAFLVNGVCTVCPLGTTFNSQSGTCQSICQQN